MDLRVNASRHARQEFAPPLHVRCRLRRRNWTPLPSLDRRAALIVAVCVRYTSNDQELAGLASRSRGPHHGGVDVALAD